MLHHVHGVIRFDAVLERRGEYVHDNIVTQNRRRSVAAIVIQSTIEILVGGDLILLGLVLRQVALPLEAACWWRWRLSRMDAEAALILARALSSFRDYVSVR